MQQIEAIRPRRASFADRGSQELLPAQCRAGRRRADQRLDGQGGYETALKYFVSHQVDCFVIQVLSQEELDPDVKGDLKLVDCEDQDEAEITVSAPLLSRYKQTLNAFTSGAQDFCSRRGIHYLLANNRVPVDDLVASHLRRRGLLR